MNKYQDFKDYLGNKADRPLCNNTRVQSRPDDSIAVKLHNTDVVTFHPDGRVVLDSGGWRTVTTKSRINEYTTVRLYQDKSIWYIAPHAGDGSLDWDNPIVYADGITLNPGGSFTGAGEDPKAGIKLARDVSKFSRDYSELFIAGGIRPPSGGDCWMCAMKIPGEHLESHIKEKYYVPSLLNRAAEFCGSGTLSTVANDFVARMWSPDHETPSFMANVVKRQIAACIRKYMRHELNLAG